MTDNWLISSPGSIQCWRFLELETLLVCFRNIWMWQCHRFNSAKVFSENDISIWPKFAAGMSKNVKFIIIHIKSSLSCQSLLLQRLNSVETSQIPLLVLLIKLVLKLTFLEIFLLKSPKIRWKSQRNTVFKMLDINTWQIWS